MTRGRARRGLGLALAAFALGAQAPGGRGAPAGLAHMLADGTIILDRRAGAGGADAGAGSRIAYPPDHPQYAAILRLLGGLLPGESRPMPPLP